MWGKSTNRERRRFERSRVEWQARCWREGRPDQSTPCRIIDVTRAGAGLIIASRTLLRESDHIVIEILKLGSTPVLLTLRGTVLRVDHQTDDGEIHMGVTLTFTTPHDQRTAQTLFSSSACLGVSGRTLRP